MNLKIKGILLIIASAFFFALMNASVRMAGDLPTMEKSFFRNIVAVVFAYITIKRSHIAIHIPKTEWGPLFLRCFFGTMGILCNFYAIDHLVLADASILNKLSPFFAIIFSFLLLREKIHPFAACCVITAFAGSIFIIKPGFAAVSSMPSLIGMLGGMSAGLAYTCVRILGTRGVRGPIIVFAFSAFSSLVTFPFMVATFVPMRPAQLIALLFAGLFATGGQFTITAAYTYAPARDISIYDYSQIIFSTILGFLLFSQVPDGWSILGYVIIICASLAMFLFNQREAVAE